MCIRDRLLGVAVGTFFTGAEFTVNRMNMAAVGGDTAISQWATPWHGLEAVSYTHLDVYKRQSSSTCPRPDCG